MTTYTQTDVLNQQAAVATAKLAVTNAQVAYNAAMGQLQVIQATILQQNADAAIAAAANATLSTPITPNTAVPVSSASGTS